MDNINQADPDPALAQGLRKVPASVVAAQVSFYVIAAIWALFGIVSLARPMSFIHGNPAAAWILVILMFANALVLFWIGRGIGKQKRRFFYLAILVLAVNIFLTVTDEFGIFDLVTLLIDAGLFVLLLVTRSEYIPGR